MSCLDASVTKVSAGSRHWLWLIVRRTDRLAAMSDDASTGKVPGAQPRKGKRIHLRTVYIVASDRMEQVRINLLYSRLSLDQHDLFVTSYMYSMQLRVIANFDVLACPLFIIQKICNKMYNEKAIEDVKPLSRLVLPPGKHSETEKCVIYDTCKKNCESSSCLLYTSDAADE